MKFDSGSGFAALPLAFEVDPRPQTPGYETADIDMTCTGRFTCIDWYALTAASGVLKVKNVRTQSSSNDLLIVPFTMAVAYPITSDDFSVMIGDQEATVVVNHTPAPVNNFAIQGWTFCGIAYFFQTFDSNPPRFQDVDFVFHGELGLFGPGPSCIGVAVQAIRARNAQNILPAADAKVLGASLHGRDSQAVSGAHQLGTGLTVTTYGRKFENALGSDPFEIIYDIIVVLLPIALNAFYGAVMQATSTIIQISAQAMEQFLPDMITAKGKLQDARTALNTPNVALALTKIQSAKSDIQVLAGLAAQNNIVNAINALNSDPVDIDTAKTELDTGITSLSAEIANTQDMLDKYNAGELDQPPASPVNSAVGLQNVIIPTSVYYEPLGDKDNNFQFESPGRSQSFYAGDPTIPQGITYGVDLQLHTQFATTTAVSKRSRASWGTEPMRGATVTFPIQSRSVDTLKELPAALALQEDGPFFNKAVANTDSSDIGIPIENLPFDHLVNSWFRSDVGEIPDEPGTVVIVWLIAGPATAHHPEVVKMFCGDREMTCFGYREVGVGADMYGWGFISGIDEVSSNEVLICTGLGTFALASTTTHVYTGVEEIGTAHVSDITDLVANTGVIRGVGGDEWPRYLRQKVAVSADTRPKLLAHAFFGRYVDFTGHPPADHFSEYSQTARQGLDRIFWPGGAIDGGLLSGDAGPYLFEEDGHVDFEYHETHVPGLSLNATSAGIAIELIGTGTAPSSTTIPRQLGTGQGWINFDFDGTTSVCLSEFDITVDDDNTALVMWMFAPFNAITGIKVGGVAAEEIFHQQHSEEDFTYNLFGHVIHVDKGTHTVQVQSSVDISGLTYVLKIDAYPGMGYHGDVFTTGAQSSINLSQTVSSDKLLAQAFLCGRAAIQFNIPDYGQKARRASESFQQLTNFETFQLIAGEAQEDDGSVTFAYDGTLAFSGSRATWYQHTFGVALELSPTPVGTPIAPSITTTDLGDLTVGVAYELQLVATGTAPITWSDPTNSLAGSGLTLSSTGLLSGTPTTGGAYSFSVTATNIAGSDVQGYTGSVNAEASTITITTSTLDTFYAGVFHSQNISYTGETPTSYEVISGSLPDGISVAVGGGTVAIGGTATAAGSYSFTLRLHGATGYGDKAYSGSILVAPVPTITTTSLGTIYQGYSTSVNIAYTGATATAAATVSGALPSGLTVDVVGGVVTVYGTATNASEAYTTTIRVTNAYGFDDQVYSGTTVAPTAPVVSTTNLSPVYVDVPYTKTITYAGAPITSISIESGAFPDGLSINLSGGVVTVSGTPTTLGSYTVRVKFTNPAGDYTVDYTGSVTTQPTPPVITTTDLGAMQVGYPFSGEIVYTGSHLIFTAASVISGSLPAGLSLHADGAWRIYLSGTPTTAGPYSFTFSFSNAGGTATQSYSGTVASTPAPTFVTTSLGGVYNGYAYSKEIEYTGATITAATVQSGTLPTGLTFDFVGGVFTIHGTPTVLGESYDFTLRFTNPGGFTDQEFTGMVVDAVAPDITTTDLGPIYYDVPFSKVIEYTGSPVDSASVPIGALPTGLGLDVTDGVVTVSGTPTVLDEAYDATIEIVNVANFARDEFTGTVVAVPGPDGAFQIALAPDTPTNFIVEAGTVIFHTVIVGSAPEFDPSTAVLTVDGTDLTPLVTPVAMIAGAPYFSTAYIIHGLAAGVHTMEMTGYDALYGGAVSYPGVTAHGATYYHASTDVTLTQEVDTAAGTLISQAYTFILPFFPSKYTQIPRFGLQGSFAMAGEAIGPATFNYDMTDVLTMSGLTWDDVVAAGYVISGIAVELIGGPIDPPIITSANLTRNGMSPFWVGRTDYDEVIISAGVETWSVLSGAFPTGMTFSNGVLYGVPTTEESYSVTVRASNSHGYVDKTYSGTVHPTPIPVLGPTSIPDFTVGEPYNVSFIATDYTVESYGMGITFSVSAGAVPDGVTFEYYGQLHGTPTTAGPYDFTVKVETQYGSDEINFTGTVSG